ncbi:MAG: AAA family ATPase, partial [Peptoniphilaceae bacterium]
MNQTDPIQAFIENNPVPEAYKDRIPDPRFRYHGEAILRAATAAILSGKNLLLVGEKSTGKNVLAENLAKLFQRPLWNVSLHMSIDAAALIGDDSLRDGNVFFREGPITMASKVGGFAVLDEINMAKNEALAVLHSTLDYRRIIDMPGYDLIKIHPATRFIATMNEGYEGTRDLNEALLSRFVVLKMPAMAERDLKQLIEETYPNLKPAFLSDLARLVADMDKKAAANEIARHAVDIRGLFDALD